MENPASWGDAERVVHEALRAVDREFQEGVLGLSRAWRVCDALRKAGLLREDPPEEKR